MRNHYRGHKMSLWLNLIPQLHRPGGDDLNMRHHHFQEEGAQFYEGETFWQRHSVNSLQSVPPNLLHFSAHNVHWSFSCTSVWIQRVLKYEMIYQLDAIEYLFVFFQPDMFQAYTPIFRSNGCYSFFTYAAYGVLGVVRCPLLLKMGV